MYLSERANCGDQHCRPTVDPMKLLDDEESEKENEKTGGLENKRRKKLRPTNKSEKPIWEIGKKK